MKYSILLLLLLTLSQCQGVPLVQYYCTFGPTFCGQSSTDDTNANASLIILAFANINTTGGVVLDTVNYPCALVTKWQSQGKKVFLSIGGASASWAPFFANPQTAIQSIQQIVAQTTIDGIDLDIQEFSTPPATAANVISNLKTAIRGKYLSLCLQNVNVYQGQAVPVSGGNYWNYAVPIIQQAGSSIDLYLVQAYNNWYDGLTQGSLQYLQDTYLNWINVASPFCDGCSAISNFTGVPQSKIVIGVPASVTAGNSPPSPQTLDQFKLWLASNNYTILGAFIWDSHWDAANQFNMSNTILTSGSNTPLTPSTPTVPSLCNSTNASITRNLRRKRLIE